MIESGKKYYRQETENAIWATEISRWNVTMEEMLAWIKQALERFGTEDTVCFFQKIGLLIKEKNGYLYPVSEQAASVLDVLRYELQTLGVEIIYGCKVQKVERTLSGKLVVNDGDREWQFDAVDPDLRRKGCPRYRL